ncbi:MAG: CHAD domain-containing protein [Sphingobium sp.]
MAYRFRRKDRSVEDAIRRIAREQIRGAIAAIDGPADPDRVIHEVRKCCKRLRGLFRLVRPAFPAYAEENAAIRDMASLIGGLRDRKVMHDLLGKLAARHRKTLSGGGWNRIAKMLDTQCDAGDSEVDRVALLAQCRDRLVQAGERASRGAMAADGWDAIAPGLVKTYARARKAAASLDDDADGHRHHELRKRVKYHLYHCQLLRPVAPDAMKAREKTAGRVSDLLGDHHDLMVLESHLRTLSDRATPIVETETAIALTRNARTRIEKLSIPLFDELLSVKPSALERYLAESWASWRG